MNDSCLSGLHAGIAVLSILSGMQDGRKREVADWLTWPLFIAGLVGLIGRAISLDLLPLGVSMFLLAAWYLDWLGGADVRCWIGLWGLWPLAGFLALGVSGLWGLVLVCRGRGKEKIPALVSTALAVGLLFVIQALFLS